MRQTHKKNRNLHSDVVDNTFVTAYTHSLQTLLLFSSAYYELSCDGLPSEKQKSSGLLVYTGTGSTSWYGTLKNITTCSTSLLNLNNNNWNMTIVLLLMWLLFNIEYRDYLCTSSSIILDYVFSLVPRPTPAIHCCTLKAERE